MSKKFGFLLGLIAGGAAALAAYQHLNPLKRRQLVDQVNQKANLFKNKAVDYAFYVDNTMDRASNDFQRRADHAKSSLGNHARQIKHRVHRNHKNPGFHSAVSHLKSELNHSGDSDDIVINANDAFNHRDHRVPVVYYPNGSVTRY